ncbi:hypothetical protein FQA39_LY02944 [Lamprigera yunnana]|nr:hypothetical protein FQA39_LY02944 [Lamprigera yunnana]
MKYIFGLSLLFAVTSAIPRQLVVPVKDAGVGNSRIISGVPAIRGEVPFQVINEPSLPQGSGFCGGSLISSHWVLTAAHCASGASSHKITLGTLSSLGDDPDAVVVHTTSHIVHENFNSIVLWNDVALIDLVTDVQFTDVIKSIPLGSGIIEPGTYVVVSGWGKTSDSGNWGSPSLNIVDLDTISKEECRLSFGNGIIDSTLCCKGHPEHSSCSGDSGGPLFAYDVGKPYHVGIISFVHTTGCSVGRPSGYARTSYFIPWIESHTGPF